MDEKFIGKKKVGCEVGVGVGAVVNQGNKSIHADSMENRNVGTERI